MSADKAATADRYHEGNLAAARVIVSDERYQGALREWAEFVLRREEERQPRRLAA